MENPNPTLGNKTDELNATSLLSTDLPAKPSELVDEAKLLVDPSAGDEKLDLSRKQSSQPINNQSIVINETKANELGKTLTKDFKKNLDASNTSESTGQSINTTATTAEPSALNDSNHAPETPKIVIFYVKFINETGENSLTIRSVQFIFTQ